MKAYVIGDITVNDTERYASYVAKAPGFVTRHGGKYLVRGGAVTTMEGDWRPGRMVVLEFPSIKHARAFANDPAYQSVADDRRSSASSRLIIVEGTT